MKKYLIIIVVLVGFSLFVACPTNPTDDDSGDSGDSGDGGDSGDDTPVEYDLEWVEVSHNNLNLESRYLPSVLTYNGNIWIIGGAETSSNITNPPDVLYSSDGINWQGSQVNGWGNYWERVGHTSVVFDDKMWVIGGANKRYISDDNTFYYPDTLYSSDGFDWTFKTSSAPWTGRAGHTSVVFDNKMWIIGGMYYTQSKGRVYLNDVWYSDDGSSWVEATPSADWSGRALHSSVVYDGKMWVIGGADYTLENDVWSSTDGVNWTQVTINEFAPRVRHTCLNYDNRMWIIGGGQTSTSPKSISTTSMALYSFNGTNWETATPWDSEMGFLTSHLIPIFDNKIWIIRIDAFPGQHKIYYSEKVYK